MPIITAPLFALAAALTRYELRDTESRIQILAFWLLAVVVQAFLPRSRSPNDGWTLLLNGTAATLAIMLTRFALEGLPPTVDRLIGY